MTDNDVAALFILVLFGGSIAWGIANRVFAHQERLAMIRRGMVPPSDTRRRIARGTVEWYGSGDSARRQLRRGITVTFVGIALTIGLSFIGYQPGDGPFGMPSITPGPWLLGGLVPLFVGLAQVVTALLVMPDGGFRSHEPLTTEPPEKPEPTWGERRISRILDPEREIPPPGQPPARP
ncbi:hypothetical protein EPN44_04900 [bacterium]|nr:MAG: hypothetical protein EPN44_04900 [bacterium]